MKYTKCLNDSCFFTNLDKQYCEIHHCFGASNRKKSESYGLKVYLSPDYHRHAPNGVHVNRDNDLIIKQFAQKCFEKDYSHQLFMAIFGRNYL